jgi:hypothetical protein
VEESILIFVEKASMSKAVISLLKNKKVTVILKTGRSLNGISFSREKIALYSPAARVDVIIEGPEQTITQLLAGIATLKHLKATNMLRVSGSFREILLLESIFFLCKPYESRYIENFQ